MIRRRVSVLITAAALVLACSAGVAQAGTIYDFGVQFDDGTYLPVSAGEFTIYDLDAAQTRRIVVSPPTGPAKLDTAILPAGGTSYSSPVLTVLSPGDTISIRQPGNAATATEVFTIPAPTLDVVNGASSLTGTVPAGWIGSVLGDYRCSLQPNVATVGAGAFNVAQSSILPGEIVDLSIFNATGDRVGLLKHSPGETPCIEVDATSSSPSAPGGSTYPTPYSIEVEHMLASVAPSVRVVLRRGGAILVDASEDDFEIDVEFAGKPLPGDVVEVYRPKTAPAPSYAMTVPQASAVFDPAIDQVAMISPAAGRIRAHFCRRYICASQSTRTLLNTPAGVNFLDFSKSQADRAPVDLRSEDVITGFYDDPAHILSYSFDATVGDLVAPVQSFRLASKIKRKSLVKAYKKGFKVNLKSNELATAKLTLTLPPVTTKSKKKSKKKPKTVTLATATKSAAIGTTTVYLKFTKSGKTALKKLSKKSSRTAVLTSIVTDASGNSSTVVKRTKIKP